MSAAQNPHKRITTGEDDEDIDPLVDQQGCGRVYAKLEVGRGKPAQAVADLQGDKLQHLASLVN